MKENNPDIYDEKIKSSLHKILEKCENGILKSLAKQRKYPGEIMNNDDSNPDSLNSDFIIDMFLKLFVEFHTMSNKITNEFIDSHTVHRRDSRQLVVPDSLKNYILDTQISQEEKEKRIQFLWNEIEDLIQKHIALLAGYKSSIKYGLRLIVQ